MRRFLTVISCALALLSCTKALDPGSIVKTTITVDDPTDVTPFSANISARVILGTGVTYAWPSMSFSTSPYPEGNNMGHNGFSGDDSDRKYTFFFRDLKPGTTYYYRASVEYEMVFDYKTVYSETKSFSTPALEPFIVTHPIESEPNLIMRGSLSVAPELIPSEYSLSYYFSCGTRNSTTGEMIVEEVRWAQRESDESFTADFPWTVGENTVGFFKAGVFYYGEYYWGEEQTFTK